MRGACVTVTPTNYIYTMGEESGAEIGLIHYARFPKDDAKCATTVTKEAIKDQAIELGWELLEKCYQGSFTIMTPDSTYFFSKRDMDE